METETEKHFHNKEEDIRNSSDFIYTQIQNHDKFSQIIQLFSFLLAGGGLVQMNSDSPFAVSFMSTNI